MTRSDTREYHIYGLRLISDYAFRTPLALGAPPASAGPPLDLHFTCRLVDQARALRRSSRIYASRETNTHGESAVELYAGDGAPTETMRFPRVADFLLRPGAIECELLDPDCRYLVDICLFGHVLCYCCERLSFTAIHAGAVEIAGKAAVFAADSTGGKSTMVASLVRAGAPLLADDIAVLETDDDGVTCHRGYPQFKMTSDQIAAFTTATGANEFELIHPAFEKVGVPAERVGGFAAGSLPVGAIYLLHRDRSTEAQVTITPVPPAEALMHLIHNSFIAQLVDATDMRAERLGRLSRIVKSVPVLRLRYPSGYESLPAVNEAVRGDLARRE